MNISESQLTCICKFLCYRYKDDSHYQMERYCSRPKYKKGYEPKCRFQCCNGEEEMSYSYKEAKDRLSELLKCTAGLMSGDHEAMRVGIFAIKKIEQVIPLLDTDIDEELALERIREVVYNDISISDESGKENL